MTYAECQAQQALQFEYLLTYAENHNVDFVWVLGDLTELATTTSEQNTLRDSIAAHPTLTYHYVAGNHDIKTNNCTEMERYLVDALNNTPDVRRPHWETWIIDNVHFMGLNASLWSFDAPACYALSYDGNCRAIDDTSSGTCSAGTTGVGRSTCDADEACIDFDAYAVNQMAALGTFADNFETARAAGTATTIFFASHVLSWRRLGATTNVGTHNEDFWVVHDMEECSTTPICGTKYCNAANLGCNCSSCGGSVSQVVNEDWRSQIEDHLADIGGSTVTRWVAGHSHTTSTPGQGVTAAPDSVLFENDISIGTAAGAQGNPQLFPLSGFHYIIDANGNVTRKIVNATPQGVGIR
jgi:hypothetical protein